MGHDSTLFDDRKNHQHLSETSHLVLTVVNHRRPEYLGRRCPLHPMGRLLLGRGGTALGRGVLNDRLLSRQHAELSHRDDTPWLTDLDSLNGTFLNGQPVRETALKVGDIVGMGDILLLVHLGLIDHTPPQNPRLIGQSPAIGVVLRQISQVAPHQMTVLVQGETGVGKELVAREIHRLSGRRGSFVAVNCGSLAEGLMLSELFGHVRGAFSGAVCARTGLVDVAQGGTLFLDEIGDAPAALQVALLRLLQEQEYRPVGSERLQKSDLRFVAATHRDLKEGSAGFRPDLLARLSRWVIEVPPLRERPEDIPLLIQYFLSTLNARPRRVDRTLALALLRHDWPGNVRELSGLVERLVIEAGEGEVLEWADWLPHPSTPGADEPEPPPAPSRPRSTRLPSEALLALLLRHGGNMKAASQELGIGRSTLYRWCAAAGINPQDIRG